MDSACQHPLILSIDSLSSAAMPIWEIGNDAIATPLPPVLLLSLRPPSLVPPPIHSRRLDGRRPLRRVLIDAATLSGKSEWRERVREEEEEETHQSVVRIAPINSCSYQPTSQPVLTARSDWARSLQPSGLR